IFYPAVSTIVHRNISVIIATHTSPYKEVLDADLAEEWNRISRQLCLIRYRERDMEGRVKGDYVAIDRRHLHQLVQGAVLTATPPPRAIPRMTETRSPNNIWIVVGVHINKNNLAHLYSRVTDKCKAIRALFSIGSKVD